MPRTSSSSASEHCESDSGLIDVIARLADELRVVRDVLDEIREEVSWSVRNDRAATVRTSILKEMPLDATADWSGGVRIIHSTSHNATHESEPVAQGRELIRRLLTSTELNLDELEEATRELIGQARRERKTSCEPPPSVEQDADGVSPIPSPVRDSGRLF